MQCWHNSCFYQRTAQKLVLIVSNIIAKRLFPPTHVLHEREAIDIWRHLPIIFNEKCWAVSTAQSWKS